MQVLYDPLSDPDRLEKLVTIEQISEDREFAGGDVTKKFFLDGINHFESALYADAISAFEKAKSACPQEALEELWAIHHNIGLAREKSGDLKGCVAELERSLEYFEMNPLVLNQIYRVCMKIGEPEYVKKGKARRLTFGML